MLVPERVAAGRKVLDAPLLTMDGGKKTIREFLADPLIILVWSSW